MSSVISPNMNLVVPGIGTEYSPTWASDLNASLSSIDSHNHSAGQGVQITPSGLNINADLAFQGNNATLLRSTRFSPQSAVLSGAADVGCLYVVNNELYYNDVTGGHNVQMTSNGSVNATSSGISSGTASASFSAGVLVVKSSSTSFANIDMQSAILSNSGNLSNQLTLQAPSLSGSYSLTLPSIPSSQSFVTVDTSGNISGYASISAGITGSNVASGTITGTNIASATITGANIASATVARANIVSVGQQISSSCGNYTTTSGTISQVTNLSVSLTTNGNPVMILIQPDGSSNAANIDAPSGQELTMVIVRGATTIATYSIAALKTPTSIQMLDTPSAGTYTYSVGMSSTFGGAVGVSYSVLVAYEII